MSEDKCLGLRFRLRATQVSGSRGIVIFANQL